MNQLEGRDAFAAETASHSQEAAGFLNLVYFWMFVGLVLTSAVSWATLNFPSVFVHAAGMWGFLVIGELLLVVVLSAAINKLSAGTATVLFLLYSIMNGLTLALIMALYTGESVTMAFVSAACLFGTMSLYGYLTRRDLTSIGRMLQMGLIALVVCLIINLFMRSSGFSMLLSVAGVAIFTGLVAYDTQKILKMGNAIATAGDAWVRKAAIMGALALYLDFINLFLYMLRLFGKRK